jgi:ATP-dependent helicase HrpA
MATTPQAPPPTLTVRYPEELPVSARRHEIAAAVAAHQVVVVAGETGSGKTTQLPKICLELGRGGDGAIGHTQPRRIAARSVAERIAEELGTDLGDLVGYKVRFTDQVSAATRVKVMTDGILLAEIARDRDLRAYDTLIIDEAHERSLNIDFLLGYVRGLLPRRPDLKVIVTSATIDTARFAEYFGGAPVVEVTGRSYPVDIRYRPLDDEAAGDGEDPGGPADPIQAIVDAVDEIRAEGPGDILVFCSGERDIHDAADALAAAHQEEAEPPEILPLYARLSATEQHRVFTPHARRRIVLATNVAETSLTVPGIRGVVDPGTARISRYSRRTKVQRLPIEPVSRASADQRAGRCGRVGPGTCIRLYSEEDYEARPRFTDPEILRTNLASVILAMADLDLGDVASFGFLDPPDARAVADGVALLTELGALGAPKADRGDTDRPRLTRTGRRLARLPVDPRLARMVVEAEQRGALREVVVLAAALSIQDPREHPADHLQAANEAHARFTDPDSDFTTLLNLWDHLSRLQRELSGNQFRKRCRAEYLNFLRIREWQDIAAQIRHVLRERGVRANREPAGAEAVHRSLLAGLLSQVGVREGETRQYIGARQARFAIAGGTPLAKKQPRWVMAGELVETNRLWARRVARISPDWVEAAAGPLLKRSHGDPLWDGERGSASVVERATLYGIPVVTARRVPYARVDRDDARDLFIEQALVEGDWEGRPELVDANRAVLDDVSARRRSGAGSDAEVLFRFYDERLPADVASGRELERWWRRAGQEDPDLLTLTPELAGAGDEEALDPDAYPDWWVQGDLRLALTYTWQPGEPDDGVTVTVPIGDLDRVDPAPFAWQVPGLRPELVVALLRSLPKALRRAVGPAPAVAAAFLEQAGPGDGDLGEVLARFLARRTGEAVRAASFAWAQVPDHLRPHFTVVDRHGRPLGSGNDLASLASRIDDRLRQVVLAGPGAEVARRGITRWDLGELPATVSRTWSGHTVCCWVALVDEQTSVAVRAFDDEVVAAGAMWAGTRRLLALTVPSPAGVVRRRLRSGPGAALALLHAPGGVDALVADCVLGAVDRLLLAHGGPVRDAVGWDRLHGAVAAGLPDEADAVAAAAARVLAARAGVESRLAGLTGAALEPSVGDVRRQVAALVRPGFVTANPDRLDDLARYLRAAERRLEVLPADPARDQRRMLTVLRLAADARDVTDPVAGERIRWLLEELRVSLWAQHLGTAEPVSEARVGRAIAQAG